MKKDPGDRRPTALSARARRSLNDTHARLLRPKMSVKLRPRVNAYALTQFVGIQGSRIGTSVIQDERDSHQHGYAGEDRSYCAGCDGKDVERKPKITIGRRRSSYIVHQPYSIDCAL